MEDRDYQARAAAWLAKRKRGLLVAPAGSGKSLMLAMALRDVVMAKPRNRAVRVGWMANTIEQCQQARAALDTFPEMAPLIDAKIACAAAQTDWTDRDVVIGDEIHHAATAPTWLAQVASFRGTLWGMTATPWKENDPEADEVLRRLFSGQVYTIGREMVADKLAPAKVIMLDASDPGLEPIIDARIEQEERRRLRWWKGERWELHAQVAWTACVEFGIVRNSARTQAAIDTAKSHASETVLLLVNQIEHAKAICSSIPGSVPCYSRMGSTKRRETLAAFRSGALKCMVASSVADEGMDVPRISVIILVSGGRSQKLAEQRTGRALRLFPGKEHAAIYDFEDRFHPMARKHSLARQAVYRKLGYNIL